MNADGSSVTRLTTDSTADHDVQAWSPDRSKLLITSQVGGKPAVFVINADGSGQHRLTDTPFEASGSTWSPDGTRIALHEDTSEQGCHQVFVMNADGSAPTKLTKEPDCNWAPSWSPDGKKLVFATTRDGNFDIWTMNPDGTAQTVLGRNPATNDADPVFSPNGSKILFTTWDGSLHADSAEIAVMNANGSDRHQLTTNGVEDFSGAWSPDGTKIVYWSKRAGNFEIFVMNADGSDQTQLTHDPSDDMAPIWK
jgi:TolB protein